MRVRVRVLGGPLLQDSDMNPLKVSSPPITFRVRVRVRH